MEACRDLTSNATMSPWRPVVVIMTRNHTYHNVSYVMGRPVVRIHGRNGIFPDHESPENILAIQIQISRDLK